MTAPDRDELRAHLIANRIAGDIATPRENNLRNIGLAARRDPQYMFGLQWDGRWTEQQILQTMVERAGIIADPSYVEGPDTIDPDRTLARLDAMAARLVEAAHRRERVLLATGHPSGLLPIHLAIASALRSAGATVVTPGIGLTYESGARGVRWRRRQIRYLGGVAMASSGGELNHTHSSRPMELILTTIPESGADRPDLVVADHGWAGAAGQAGFDTVGFADSNDPALFVGEADGRVRVVVPLDDNVLPHLYEPVAAYLIRDLLAQTAQSD
jgi:Phosphatase